MICCIGRIFFALIFIIKPFEHFTKSTVDYADSMGIPLSFVVVPFWGLLALLGGLSVLLGYRVKIGAWLIVIFLLPTTFVMHPFWRMDTDFGIMMHHYCFWKNLALMGAAMMLSYFGAGPYSIDQR